MNRQEREDWEEMKRDMERLSKRVLLIERDKPRAICLGKRNNFYSVNNVIRAILKYLNLDVMSIDEVVLTPLEEEPK